MLASVTGQLWLGTDICANVIVNIRSIAKEGGVGAVGRPPALALKGYISVDRSSANILNIVRLWNRVNKIAQTCRVNSSFDHKVTSSVIIILKFEVSARQPLGTPIFKP